MCDRSRYQILSGFLTYAVLLMRYPKIRVRVYGDGAGSVAMPIFVGLSLTTFSTTSLTEGSRPDSNAWLCTCPGVVTKVSA